MRLLTWYVEGLRVGTSQKETYRLDGDYNPVRAWVHFGSSPNGVANGTETIIDINADGESIFSYRPRSLNDADIEESVFSTVQLSKDTLITLDIDAIAREPGRDMTVGLELEAV